MRTNNQHDKTFPSRERKTFSKWTKLRKKEEVCKILETLLKLAGNQKVVQGLVSMIKNSADYSHLDAD